MKNFLSLSILLIAINFIANAQTLEIIGNGNLRSGPSTSTEIIGKVSIGTKVTQIDFSNDWYKVEFSNKTIGWVYKTLVKIEKQSNVIISQKKDTIELAANGIANIIRDALLKSYKRQSYGTGGLLITIEYPLYLTLSNDLNGSDAISGTFDNIAINGKINLVNKGEMKMIFNNLNNQSSGTPGSYTMVDPSSTFLSIGSGEFTCGGFYFINTTIPLYFEKGKMIFTDNVNPCTFTIGSVLFYNSVRYTYYNSRWTQSDKIKWE